MTSLVTEETDGHVRKIGLNRPEKRNAMNIAFFEQLSAAFARAEADEAVRVTVLFAHGPMFTAGLDLMDVFPRLGEADVLFRSAGVDPWGTHGPSRTKPLIVAVHGKCLTLGVELMLAGDISIASEDATFEQIEIDRGIFPFGGGTARWVQTMGWGNAMQYLLTGDALDAREAHRLGLVQRVVAREALMETAMGLAKRIASKPPLAIQATLESARTAVLEGERAAAAKLFPAVMRLAATEDVQEALTAFMERRPATFRGR
ncbi:crotonase/enoyl-CoA hydratase family protein [Stigmatella aurantiaca]|uniref:Carnitinyl-CoA dehydratase n=1 Tax=Stigmatella aurantiaca (strain DW4/3-1) TaxID=378806 RepID=Q08YD6_STIAD|nr:crotonase/enoyl-CoA hydratase family protein [Stigmatella aurantiaca]ADO70173.1 Enoyl-CoA hydratase/isomerase family protein [Stigmatella aurantiaca DW4/3-1]EAU65508.1 carnitinyl-CoA dehydratase [Stigmatella aurantiaca DW4/3-1]